MCDQLIVLLCIPQDQYQSIPAAIEAVRAGKAWGALYFPSNYSRFLAARHVWGRYASDKALNHSEISVWMDMSSESLFFPEACRGFKGLSMRYIRRRLVAAEQGSISILLWSLVLLLSLVQEVEQDQDGSTITAKRTLT